MTALISHAKFFSPCNVRCRFMNVDELECDIYTIRSSRDKLNHEPKTASEWFQWTLYCECMIIFQCIFRVLHDLLNELCQWIWWALNSKDYNQSESYESISITLSSPTSLESLSKQGNTGSRDSLRIGTLSQCLGAWPGWKGQVNKRSGSPSSVQECSFDLHLKTYLHTDHAISERAMLLEYRLVPACEKRLFNQFLNANFLKVDHVHDFLWRDLLSFLRLSKYLSECCCHLCLGNNCRSHSPDNRAYSWSNSFENTSLLRALLEKSKKPCMRVSSWGWPVFEPQFSGNRNKASNLAENDMR